MRHLLALQGRYGPVPEESVERACAMAGRTLPYRWHPYRQQVWRSPSGRVVLLAWDNDPDASEQLIQVIDAGRAVIVEGGQDHERQTGNSSRVVVDPATDRIEGQVTLTRLVPLYWVETAAAWMVGSRALLLARLASPDGLPRYDLQGLAALAIEGWIRSEQTPFEGVHIVGSQGTVRVDAQGVRATVPPREELGVGTLDGAPETLRDFEDHLVRTVDTMAGSEVRCAITGGRDSRLVAAALYALGRPCTMYTIGRSGDADVVVGQRVAEALGQGHERVAGIGATETDHVELDLAARTRHALFATDGMLSARSNAGRRSDPWNGEVPTLGGQGGESLRGGYAKLVGNGLDITWEQAEDWLGRKSRSFGRLFRPGMLDDRDATARRELDADRRVGSCPADALDRFYVTFRTGRWAAAARASRTTDELRLPLFDDGVTRRGVRFGSTVKAHNQLVQELTVQLAPPLRDLPYAGRVARSVDTAEAARAGPAAQRRFDFTLACTDAMYPAFRERLVGRRGGDALAQVVDHRALERWITRRAGTTELGELQVELIWGLLSVSVMLSNEWLEPDTGPTQMVRIPVPAWAAKVHGHVPRCASS